ncbi:hypothetical protein HOLDEFILI_03950 [Holdemania filiformis DSM 12042]|uniref:Uncharacterized protein n=1 Tax=Holdemania filiformis DSM 12042 TaxID=545696 RepID=B9YDM7_9FIRM|nr:hypothetical protein HOLDEFILI_03950 [Holdemania filiformis DSM 12042]
MLIAKDVAAQGDILLLAECLDFRNASIFMLIFGADPVIAIISYITLSLRYAKKYAFRHIPKPQHFPYQNVHILCFGLFQKSSMLFGIVSLLIYDLSG